MLRLWHVRIECWALEQAKVEVKTETESAGVITLPRRMA